MRPISKEEWLAAETLGRVDFPDGLRVDQIRLIRSWAAERVGRQRQNVFWHNLLNTAVLILLLASDISTIWLFPRLFDIGEYGIWAAGLLAALVHGTLAYSMVVFSLHEGAAHDLIILGKGPTTTALRIFASNLCRLFFADPIFYKSNHLLHHSKFATQEDGAFSNFVSPRRILISLLPFVHLVSLSDYQIHKATGVTRSRLWTALLSILYALALAYIAVTQGGWMFAILSVGFLGPWIGFSLDRLRESSEHSLMPLHIYNGSRDLGTSVWAFWIGGGPWGQPCHLSHHLGPGLAWYNQIRLHSYLRKTLEPRQQQALMMQGSYPRFAWRTWRRLCEIDSVTRSLVKAEALTKTDG
jgi:fatty acid desaturase